MAKATEERDRQHYLIEKELATRLRNSTKTERAYLYTELYDELFRRVPYHGQLVKKSDSASTANVKRQLRLIAKMLTTNTRFVEIGPGDCRFALMVAERVKSVTVIDVSNEVTKNIKGTANFHLVISDGSNINLPPGSVDIAYSNQLIEHLHPDDTMEHLKSVYSILAPGGVYVCCTPNRLSGPHDVSSRFDDIATGFHLKEYTFSDLAIMLRKTGFKGIKCDVGGRGRYLPAPLFALKGYEKLVSMIPRPAVRKIRKNPAFEASLNIHVIATK